MRTAIALTVAACVAWSVGGCGGPAEKAGEPAVEQTVAAVPAGEVVLEAEQCTLKDCEAKALSGASGGKAVLMSKESSEARGTVALAKGKYKVVVHMQGAASDEDAVYIRIGQGSRTRVYADEHGSVVPATLYESDDRFFTVTIDQDGACPVLLTTAETNVYVDRIVFTRQE